MEKLNDNPCALAIVLQGNHSHDVAGIFGSYVGKQHQWWKALIIITQSFDDILLLVLTRIPRELVTKNKDRSGFLTGYPLEINWV